ncbi:MAG: hypothetical protein MUC96_24775 [Myxococcaceae bacterium]|nr:hypothetical protein [Myxococcaceae bacterium]
MRRLVVLLVGLHAAGCTYGFRTDCDGDAGEARVGPFCYPAGSAGGAAGGAGGVGGGVGGGGGGGGGGAGGGVVEPDAGGPCDFEPLVERCACRPGERCLEDGGCGVADPLALELVQVPDPVLVTPALVCGRVTLADGGTVPTDVALPDEVTVSAPGLEVGPAPLRVGRAGRFTFTVRVSPGQWVDRRMEVSAPGAMGLIMLPRARQVSVSAPPLLDVNPSTLRGPQWAVGAFAPADPRVDDTTVTVRARWEDGGPGATPGAPPALRLDGGLLSSPCACGVGWLCVCAAIPVPEIQESDFASTFDAVVRYDDGGLEAARTTFPVTRYRWVTQAGGAVVAAPAIDFEGNVYLGTRTAPGAGALVSFGPLGELRWSLPLGDVQSVALSTLSDGGLVGYSTAMTETSRW